MSVVAAKYRDVVCGECQRTFVTKETRKLFCDPCGVARRNRRQSDRTRYLNATNEATRVAISEAVADRAMSMTDAFAERPDFLWSTWFRFPYSLNASKNRRWSNNGKGVVYLTGQVRSFEADLVERAKFAIEGRKIAHAKLWVSIFVQKPNHRSDAVNVVDTICDALKKALELDDRWFAIERVDWEIKKKDPEIFVRLGQTTDRDMLACSYCGGVFELDHFPRKKNGPFGHDRVCKSCQSALNWAANRAAGAESRPARLKHPPHINMGK